LSPICGGTSSPRAESAGEFGEVSAERSSSLRIAAAKMAASSDRGAESVRLDDVVSIRALQGCAASSQVELSPRLSQLDSCFIERGTLSVKRLHRTPQISLYPWGSGFPEKPEPKPEPRERPDGMKLAHHYQALLDSGKFENRAALARHPGVSRARVTQVLRRLG